MAAKSTTEKKTTTAKRPSRRPASTRTIDTNGDMPHASLGPSREQIAQRAFELFLARGGQHGHHVEDWLRAEREIREVHGVS